MQFITTGKESQIMNESSNIYRYLRGGKGEVILVNPVTGNAHKYSFESPRNKGEFDVDTIFVYVHHDENKMYLGKLTETGIVLTRSSRFGPHTDAFKGAQYIVMMSLNQKLVNSNKMILYNNGKCCKCGRSLKNSGSIYCGLGKKCLEIVQKESTKPKWQGDWEGEDPFLNISNKDMDRQLKECNMDVIPDDPYNRTWEELQFEYC